MTCQDMFAFRKKNYTSTVAKIKLFITLFNRTDNKLQKKTHQTQEDIPSTVCFLWQQSV